MNTTPRGGSSYSPTFFDLFFSPQLGSFLTANEIFPLLNTVKDVEKKDLYVEDGLQQSEERAREERDVQVGL